MLALGAEGTVERAMAEPGFPASVLSEDEDLVFDVRPHWIALTVPVAQTLAIVAAVIIVWLVLPFSWGSEGYLFTMLLAVAAFLAGPSRGFIRWATSHFVLTTERIMRRSGWIAQESIDIPLEKISDVRFRQDVLERLVGAGDLIIESAGRSGQELLHDVRHPDRMQRRIFEMKTRLSERLIPGDAGGTGLWGGPASVADELTKLHQLVSQGVLTEDEFRTAKARLLRRV